MLNVSPSIYTQLATIGLPVVAEGFLTKDIDYPCISYYVENDVQANTGDNLMYSNVYYTVKVWGKRLSDMITNAVLVDSKMRELGFRRIATNQVWVDDIGSYVLRYRALGLEELN